MTDEHVRQITPITDAEANAMLRQLAEHFHCPVMPVEWYCEALRTWATCIEKLNRDPATPEWSHGHEYARLVGRIDTDIRKSSLLWRLIYGGEQLRTEPCPKHKGKWSGISPCEHGCDSTGWLPLEVPHV